MKIKEKLERGFANIWVKPFFNVLVKIFLDDPKAYYKNDINSRLNHLRWALYFNHYEYTHDCSIELSEVHQLISIKNGTISKSIEKGISIGFEGEKWVKDQKAFYLLETEGPLVLTNLRNPYTEIYWKNISFKMNNTNEFTVISPLCLLRMYKEKAL